MVGRNSCNPMVRWMQVPSDDACVWFRVLSITFQEAIGSLGGPSGTSNQHSQDRLILLGGLGDDDRRYRDAWQTTDFGLTWQELPCPKWSGRWAAKNGATSNTLNKFFRETVWLLGAYPQVFVMCCWLYVLIGLPFCLLWHGITLLTYHHLTIMWPVNNLSVRHGNVVAIARQQLSNPSIWTMSFLCHSHKDATVTLHQLIITVYYRL